MTTFGRSTPIGWPKPERGPMSFAAGFHAPTSRLPERGRGSPGRNPASGANTPGSLARYDRDSSLWKTSQLCLDGGLQTFSETWPRSGMMRSGIAYRLPPLEPLTGATASGYWPTPNLVDAEGGVRTGKGQVQLCHVIQGMALWPTPTVNGNNNRAGLTEKAGDGLSTAVKLWPTPAARDYRAPNKPDGASRLSRPPTSGEQLPNAVGGVLNPEWVELLMGFPPGHTAIR